MKGLGSDGVVSSGIPLASASRSSSAGGVRPRITTKHDTRQRHSCATTFARRFAVSVRR
jgi:hypothetical protein